MSWGATVILILFGAFVLLVILNPNISCFGKRIRSPFYPLLRKKPAKRKTTDYHFHLADGPAKEAGPENAIRPEGTTRPAPKTDDYGFRLD